MRLTNYDRDSFVRAVLNDVPQIDYNAKAEALIRAAHEKSLPPKIKAVFDDTELRDRYLRVHYFNPSAHLNNIALYAGEGFSLDSVKGLREKVFAIASKAAEQSSQRQSLRLQIKAAIYGCNTLKQACDTMPELIKYLPQDRGGKVTRQLPAIGNLVSDLTKAGWQKK